MQRLCGVRGYSMFELIAVMAILGVVMSGITTLFVSGSHAELQNNYRFQAQQTARLALDQLRLDVRGACAANVPSSAKLILAYVPAAGTGTPAGPAYALYRSTQLDAAFTCNSTVGKLIADRLTQNVLFSSTTPIPIGQFQTVTVMLPVSFKEQTFGAPYKLTQTLTVRNTVRQTISATQACPNTVANLTCTFGLCGSGTCYPPQIQ
jgi:prepilin-type N-terminal cleavage/methylation domain-containing protein